MTARERAEQLRRWIEEAPTHEADAWEDVVMWGVWRNADSEDVDEPSLLIGTEEEANAAAFLLYRDDYAVLPVIVTMRTRNNFEVPEDAGRRARFVRPPS